MEKKKQQTRALIWAELQTSPPPPLGVPCSLGWLFNILFLGFGVYIFKIMHMAQIRDKDQKE